VNSLARRRKFFFEIAIVPFALGCLITSFLTYPMNMSTHVLYLSTIGIGLITAWYLLSYVQVMKYELVRYKSLQKINVFFSILLLVAGLIVFITYRGTYFPV
jgi:phosphate/sulfate permease